MALSFDALLMVIYTGQFMHSDTPNPPKFLTKGFPVIFLSMGCIQWQEQSLPKSDPRKGVKTGSHPRWPLMTLNRMKMAYVPYDLV